MKTLDSLIESIVDSYNSFGGVNLSEINSYPNSETVVSVLKDLQALIFPGFKTAETIDKQNLKILNRKKNQQSNFSFNKRNSKSIIILAKVRRKFPLFFFGRTNCFFSN